MINKGEWNMGSIKKKKKKKVNSKSDQITKKSKSYKIASRGSLYLNEVRESL